ncbi:hypothetical protein MNBD_GAMMA07-1700 [hydrothermal vent metagenome]|uniref:TIGR03016 family PEP-CTERM system-associated outer membrane protein n=1 Tax=hydrothermal vent metagenome TaxID=652676 RepID=A0A3B0WQG8_9ZZZZ
MLYFKKFIIICTVFIYFDNVNAADVNYGISTTVSTFSNINRLTINSQSEKSLTLTPFISIVEDTSLLRLDLNARSNLINFESSLNGDRNVSNLSSSALWRIYPGQFEWFISDVFTQTAIDPLLANGLSNRQDVNVFDTGPNFLFRIKARNTIRVEPRIQNTIFENPGADNIRFILRTIYDYNLNSYINFTMNYNFEKIDVDNQAFNPATNQVNDFDSLRNDVFITANYRRASDIYDVELGFTKLGFGDNTVQDKNVFRFGFSLTRQFNRLSNIRFLLNRSLDDVSRNLTNTLAVNGNVTAVNAANTDFFLNENLRVIYNTNYFAWNFTAETFFNSLDYVQQTVLSRNQSGVLLDTVINLSARSSLSLGLEYRNSDFDTVVRDDSETLYSLIYNYQLRRNFSLSLQAINQDRSSTGANLSFEDTRFFISLTYNSG